MLYLGFRISKSNISIKFYSDFLELQYFILIVYFLCDENVKMTQKCVKTISDRLFISGSIDKLFRIISYI